MHVSDHALADLTRQLELSRIQVQRRLYLKGGLLIVIAVAMTFVALEALRALIFALWAQPFISSLSSLASAALVLALGLIWLIAHVRRATPTVLELAKRADRHFDLDERLSTALELVGQSSRSDHLSSLMRHLYADARAHVPAVESTSLVQIPIGRELRYLLISMAAVGGLLILPRLPSVQGGLQPQVDGAEAAPAEREDDDTVAYVRRAAELVARDAEERNDPYLRALAANLEDLGAKAAGGEVNHDELALELERLMTHLNRAYGTQAADLANTVAPSVQNLQEEGLGSQPSADGTEPNTAAAVAQIGLDPAGSSMASADQADATDASARTTRESPLTLESLLQQLEGGAQQQASGTEPSTAPRENELGQHSRGYWEEDPEQQAMMERRQALLVQKRELNGGQVAGAAENSTREAGDEAGEGTQPLAGGTTDEAVDFAGQTEEVMLPTNEQRQGRRIRIELPPEAELTSLADVAGPVGSNWRRAPEVPVGQSVLALEHRDIVSRYFLALAQNEDGTEVESAPPAER